MHKRSWLVTLERKRALFLTAGEGGGGEIYLRKTKMLTVVKNTRPKASKFIQRDV